MKVAALLVLLGALALPLTSHGKGRFGPWRFGMSRAEVSKVKACKNYKPVRVTGGLECEGFAIARKKVKASFVFRQGALVKIQLWLYMGKKVKEASDSLHGLLQYLKRRHGPVECRAMPSIVTASKRALPKAVMHLQTKAKPTAKLQLKPKKNPKRFFTFSSLIYNQRHGFFLFMYAQPPR